MKDKILKFLREYKKSFIVALIVIIIGCIGLTLYFVLNKSSTKYVETSTYSVSYDNTWKVKSKSDTSLELNHSTNGKLKFEISTLQDERQYSSVSEILDDLIYDISNQNKSYTLLAKEKYEVTKNQYDGYKLLYETNSNQAMVVIGKKGNKLLIVTYEADNAYYDILLDSVYNIIYNFTISEEKVELSYKTNIKTSSIEWNKNDDLVANIKDTKEGVAASNNYIVKYSYPSVFKPTNFDSKWPYYEYEKTVDSNITLSATVLSKNIYEYITESDTNSVFSMYSYQKNDADNDNYKDAISEYNSGDNKCYMYKNSYSTTKYGTHSYENVELICPIDKGHIFVVAYKAENMSIPKEAIDNFKINSIQNYCTYTDRTIDGNNQISYLKYFTDYTYSKAVIIKLTLPLKYEVIDNHINANDKKYYGINYNNNTDYYQYEVDIGSEFSTSIEFDSVNRTIKNYEKYGNYKLLTESGSIVVNGKTFTKYDGEYYDYNGDFIREKAYVYGLGGNHDFIVEIRARNAEVDSTIINDIANFEISTESY